MKELQQKADGTWFCPKTKVGKNEYSDKQIKFFVEFAQIMFNNNVEFAATYDGLVVVDIDGDTLYLDDVMDDFQV